MFLGQLTNKIHHVFVQKIWIYHHTCHMWIGNMVDTYLIWGCASFREAHWCTTKERDSSDDNEPDFGFPKKMFMDHAYWPHPLNDIVQLMSQSEHKGPHFRSMVKDGDMDSDVLQRRWCDIIILIMLLELGFSYHLKGMYLNDKKTAIQKLWLLLVLQPIADLHEF